MAQFRQTRGACRAAKLRRPVRVGTTRGRRGLAGAVGAVAVAVLLASGPYNLALAGGASPDPAMGQAARARDVLERHCARCHDAAKLENPPAKGALGNILDLDTVAARDDLVTPGDPDTSRLYQIMLAQHRPLQAFFGPVPGPKPGEIQEVRDWLATLPARTAACPDRTLVTTSDIARDVTAWRKSFETDATAPLRFVSLAPLHNLCRGDGELAAYRTGLIEALKDLSGTPSATPAIETIGDFSILLAVQPKDFGLSASDWDQLAPGHESLSDVTGADALAAALMARPPPQTDASPGSAVAAAASQPLVGGMASLAALASEYTRRVTLRRAAAEVSIDVVALKTRIEKAEGETRSLALRLAQTGLPRHEWERLRPALMEGRAAPGSRPAAPGDGLSKPLTLAVWTDALTYQTGDLLNVTAEPSRDCHLTLVAIEANGLATVLFPNDSATDNKVAAGTRLSVPASGAPFQLRLDKPGRQSIVGICHAHAKRPEGIGHDFERQRFTSLGDWRQFLASTPEREEAYRKMQDDMRRFRASRGRPPEPPEEQVPVGTEDEARAGLSFIVK